MANAAESAPDWAYWDELDPKTAAVIGVFGTPPIEIFGLEKSTADAALRGLALGSLDVMPTQRLITRAYAEMNGESVHEHPDAIPRLVVDRLAECETDEVSTVTHQLAELAGGSDYVMGLADMLPEKIQGEHPYRTVPLLQALSTLALHRLAAVDMFPDASHHKLLRFAHSGEGADARAGS